MIAPLLTLSRSTVSSSSWSRMRCHIAVDDWTMTTDAVIWRVRSSLPTQVWNLPRFLFELRLLLYQFVSIVIHFMGFSCDSDSILTCEWTSEVSCAALTCVSSRRMPKWFATCVGQANYFSHTAMKSMILRLNLILSYVLGSIVLELPFSLFLAAFLRKWIRRDPWASMDLLPIVTQTFYRGLKFAQTHEDLSGKLVEYFCNVRVGLFFYSFFATVWW